MKTSIEKSHSKVSNTKLTFLCILEIICVSILWIGLILIGIDTLKNMAIAISITGGVLTILGFCCLLHFKR